MTVAHEIVIDAAKFQAALANAVEAIAAMPDSQLAPLRAHWAGIRDSGGEAAEVMFKDGVMYIAPSDDLRRAFAAFGVQLP